MNQERRKYLRLNVSEVPCRVRIGGETLDAQLLDESIGGLRIGSVALLAVAVNQVIKIRYEGENVDGVCRSVARESENLFSLGIRRDEAKPANETPSSAMLLNTFISFSGVDLLCLPVGAVDGERIRVMMMDGRQFVVERTRLFSLTRQERIERLVSEKRFRNILQVYKLHMSDNPFEARAQIIEKEFGLAAELSLAGVR